MGAKIVKFFNPRINAKTPAILVTRVNDFLLPYGKMNYFLAAGFLAAGFLAGSFAASTCSSLIPYKTSLRLA